MCRGRWNDSDCVSGLYNDAGLLRDCCRAKSEISIYSKAYTEVSDPLHPLLIIGVAVLAAILLAVMFFVSGAVLTAWTYAKSPHVQMTEGLEDNGTIEG